MSSCIICLVALPFYLLSVHCLTACDVRITSRDRRNGTFSSPGWGPDKTYSNNLRCLYRFIGRPKERVKIKFLDFEVNGFPPRCKDDYVDVYTQSRSPKENLFDIPLHGRYCGHDLDLLPHLFISVRHVFILGFYTDEKKVAKGFRASYEFIDGGEYVLGTPAPKGACGQTIYSEHIEEGTIMSPTYPGEYPDDLFCYYSLQGIAGQRIKLTFEDLDLYSGGEHCPYDQVRVYDGYTDQTHVIGAYCGKLSNFTVFSTGESMRVEFSTKSGRLEPTKEPFMQSWELHSRQKILRKGFRARFRFSSRFVDLRFIKDGYHIRGTECDQHILSSGESNGTIQSPGYPGLYPVNTVCKYYIDGLENNKDLEKVFLTFLRFNIIYDSAYSSEPDLYDQELVDPECFPSPRSCSQGWIASYLRGQEPSKSEPDQLYCGTKTPEPLMSSNPRLLLVFNTTGAVDRSTGFKAKYQFLTDYAIPGTPATNEVCHFLYRSDSSRSGRFNSPRNPSVYPANSYCVYEFYGNRNEQIRVTFESIQMENRYGNCSTDYLQFYNVRAIDGLPKETLIGQYCGGLLPGPLVTDYDVSRMKVIFISDHIQKGAGFRARYEFIAKKAANKRCFMNITSGGGGIIKSPNYPRKYLINSTCEWNIQARYPQGRILLEFPVFSIEGNYKLTGCGNSVLKLYVNSSSVATHEVCGPQSPLKDFVSQGNVLKIRFISSARSIGAKGFRIVWTELMPDAELNEHLKPSEVGSCSGFRCVRTGYCIASSLRCNGLPNCGSDDDSDEAKCNPTYQGIGMIQTVLGVIATLILLVLVIVCVIHRRRKLKKKHKQPIEVRYVSRSAPPAPMCNNMRNSHSSLAHAHLTPQLPIDASQSLLERTEKVSIV